MLLQSLNKEIVIIKLSGGKILKGSVIDSGSDIIVIYDGNMFVYLPIDHIQTLEIDYNNENNVQPPSETSRYNSQLSDKDLTLTNILSHAKGIHVEIFVTGNQALHGVISSIMNDYFVFESPIYKTMFILTKHLKWLSPYSKDQFPYGISENEFLSLSPLNNQSLNNTFGSQIDQLREKLVVFNLGKEFSHIGRVINVKDQIIEIQNGKSNSTYFNLSHIQTVHQV
ncbi:DUF2642 domain-containing protein [Lysinibacillus sp. G4S2]|uniref:DUF2642 domain-containing protein n=1 Tax=Lysinibacillus sp. G4S2 TaxID=3055859 RepID=UPI0025A11820|nr:DUF2642 domain-containing protein [Lysinibacillus sp. G4S2]MDM5247306.1 DUF2642 domain-containing protein [Lysinibacillus sp. G4S2]